MNTNRKHLNFDIPLDFDIPYSTILQSCNLKMFSPLEKFNSGTVAEKLYIRVIFTKDVTPISQRYILNQITLGTSSENKSEYDNLDICKKAYVYIIMDYVCRHGYTILNREGLEILNKLLEYEETVLGCKL